MRPFIIAGAISVGLVALWLAMLPLTAKPRRPAAASHAMAQSLADCRGPNGLDQLCVGALAKALVRDTGTVAPASAQRCSSDRLAFAGADRRD